MSFDPHEPARILQSFASALSDAAFARTQDAFQDAKDRLTGERSVADLRRLDELRKPFYDACPGRITHAEIVAKYKAVMDAAHSIRTELFQKLSTVWPFYVDEADADESVMKQREYSLRKAKEGLAGRLIPEIGWFDTTTAHNLQIVQAATHLYLSAANGINEMAFLISPAANETPAPDATGNGKADKRKSDPKPLTIPPSFKEPVKLWPKFKAEMDAAGKRPVMSKFAEWLRTRHGIELDANRFAKWFENYNRSKRRKKPATS